MAAFDPDAYLASQPAFDPDAYLAGSKSKPKTTLMQDVGQNLGNVSAGLLRGAGSIGATLLAPKDIISDAMDGKGLSLASNRQRRADMDSALSSMGAETDSFGYGAGKLAGEIAGTAGAGGAAANVIGRVPGVATRAAPLLDALRTGGFSVSGATGKTALVARVAGGSAGGALSAGAVNPEDAGTGAIIGGAAPFVLQGLGKAGSALYSRSKGVRPNDGKLLAKALGVTESELPGIIAAAKSAPESLVPGSKLTLSQALNQQGKKLPSAGLLENIVAGGPGGNILLNRATESNAARKDLMLKYGAVLDESVNDMANRTGSKLAAILRTQASDDQAAARVAWKGQDGMGGVYGRALQDDVRLHLPLDEMDAAMAPLGRGSVMPGKDAKNVLSVANDIGTYKLPEVAPLAKSPANKAMTLEQLVRSMGGIKGKGGELRDLGFKQSGTTGLINNKSGMPADIMAETLHSRGMIPDADPSTLFDILRNGGGRKVSTEVDDFGSMRRAMESSMGDAPSSERISLAAPFAEFQRLRRDSGLLAAKIGERAGGETESGVLKAFQGLLSKRADDAAGGGSGLLGENMSPEFLAQYNAARNLTRNNAELYKNGNNISQILRKPSGQDYTLNGDEVLNKVWHGGQGLLGDVQNLQNVLSRNNLGPAINDLRSFVMSDAANKTTAGGELAAQLPKYFQSRQAAMQELLSPEQFNAVRSVSGDIQNAAQASSIPGLKGSATHANISRAMDAGVLDSPITKKLSQILSLKMGIGESIRNWAAESIVKNKAQTLAALLANPKAAAQALQSANFVRAADPSTLKRLALAARLAPVSAVGGIQMLQAETQ
jgi:hypothetical protein